MNQDEHPANAAEPRPAATGKVRPLGFQAKLLFALVACGAVAALFWPQGDGSFEAPGGFLVDEAGRPSPLGPQLAPVTLVHFWATWCPPCLDEIPRLQRLSSDFATHRDFRIIKIAVSDSVEQVAGFLGDGSHGILFDPNWEVAHRFGTRQLPESYLVVRGQVVERWEGAMNWDDPALRRKLVDILEARHPTG